MIWKRKRCTSLIDRLRDATLLTLILSAGCSMWAVNRSKETDTILAKKKKVLVKTDVTVLIYNDSCQPIFAGRLLQCSLKLSLTRYSMLNIVDADLHDIRNRRCRLAKF